jgi:DNA replication licensing factor MCM5
MQCKTCKAIKHVQVRPGFGSCSIPRVCEGQPGAEGDMAKKCGVDPFIVLPDKSAYIDQQVNRHTEFQAA